MRLGEEVRAVRADLSEDTRAIRVDLAAVSAVTRESAGHLAELIPQVNTLAGTLARVEGQIRGLTADDDADGGDPPPPTPALGWDDLDPDQAGEAWQVLATWTARVLCSGLGLSRAELPDCWPVHPGAVRELTWLRTVHVAIAAREAKAAGSVAEWHARWLPAALVGLRRAIDPRECTPGVHRATKAEREAYVRAVAEAERAHTSPPPFGDPDDQAADRPRALLAHLPARRGGLIGATPRIEEEPGKDPSPQSSPPVWMPYLRDAVAEDLARRRAGAGPDHHAATDLSEITGLPTEPTDSTVTDL